MASDLENLKATKSRYLAELAAGPLKPTYTLEGQTVDWNTYRSSLLKAVSDLNLLISLEAGPCEIITEGMI
jgi:hypothetical protein